MITTQTADPGQNGLRQAAVFEAVNGRSAYLERLRTFIASHGNAAWVDLNADCVFFETRVSHADGTIETVTDQADTLADARELLGY